jgi:hypothetical protein
MYVRAKVQNGITYYQVVEGYRIDGKVKQRSIASLGTECTVAGAIDRERYRLKNFKRRANNLAKIDGYEDGPIRSDLESLRRQIGQIEEKLRRLSELPEDLEHRSPSSDITSSVVSGEEGDRGYTSPEITAYINRAEQRIGRPFTDPELAATIKMIDSGVIDITRPVVSVKHEGDAEFWADVMRMTAEDIVKELRSWPEDLRGVHVSMLRLLVRRLFGNLVPTTDGVVSGETVDSN